MWAAAIFVVFAVGFFAGIAALVIYINNNPAGPKF